MAQQVPPESSMYIPSKPKVVLETEVTCTWDGPMEYGLDFAGKQGEFVFLDVGKAFGPKLETDKRYKLTLTEID